MSRFELDETRAHDLANILIKMKYEPDTFQDLTPFKEEPFLDAHFIFFLTAIDHNTHGEKRYVEIINEDVVHGSDLMYRKSYQAAERDPDLFTPRGMQSISAGELHRIFSTGDGLAPVGLEERAELLRDAAEILLKGYAGDLRNLFTEADGYLRLKDGKGILSKLTEFKAYQDPYMKKSFLLVKLLRRKQIITVKDPEHIDVPVDHVLFTIALRSGLIKTTKTVFQSISTNQSLDQSTVNELRETTLNAYRKVALYSDLYADQFDDLLWAYGRECLKEAAPFSEEKLGDIKISMNQRIHDKAAFREFIRYINGIDGKSPEGTSSLPIPVFPKTWYF